MLYSVLALATLLSLSNAFLLPKAVQRSFMSMNAAAPEDPWFPNTITSNLADVSALE